MYALKIQNIFGAIEGDDEEGRNCAEEVLLFSSSYTSRQV